MNEHDSTLRRAFDGAVDMVVWYFNAAEERRRAAEEMEAETRRFDVKWDAYDKQLREKLVKGTKLGKEWVTQVCCSEWQLRKVTG